MKLEDNDQHFCPAFKEFSTPTNFRPIYFGEAAGRSLFHKATPEYIKKKKVRKVAKSVVSLRLKSGLYTALHFSCKEHQMHISEPEFYKEVDSLCGSFTKEIVVPNQPLRRRRTPEPLPLPENDLFE
ncbi:unnamed protein product [Gongylonema pulchrum]|uniref:Uncharacterized protein n=1 Tax=Gongylonema pulchrum TaxID=637853 RepID=A0A183EB43_9BILA|nr:unnamed protein product [Gongylonema pulchrum]